MILTPQKSTEIGEEIRARVERGLAGMGVSARRASLDVVGHDGLVRDIRAGRIPSFDRLSALFEYLGIALPARVLLGEDRSRVSPLGRVVWSGQTRP